MPTIAAVSARDRRGFQVSDDVRLALTPGASYAALASDPRQGSWLRTLARAAFSALIIGTVTPVVGIGEISLFAILSGTLAWSFAPALQLLTASALCSRPPISRVDRARAIELLFMAHAPWSIWLLAVALVLLLARPGGMALELLLSTFVLPLTWTCAVEVSYCRVVLGCSSSTAWRRSLAHQAITVVLLVWYVGFAIGLVPRIVGGLR